MATIDCKQRAMDAARLPTPVAASPRSAAVGRANTKPAVANLLIMHARIVYGGGPIEQLRREPSNRIQDRIGRHHAIMLRGDQRDTGVDQRLLGVQHVERGSLSGL